MQELLKFVFKSKFLCPTHHSPFPLSDLKSQHVEFDSYHPKIRLYASIYTMYKHKSPSRSPFSSKSPISSSQVPSFQPPSFYAAAAGIPYLPKSNSSSSTAEERREIGHSSGSQTVMTPMVPISYPTQAGMQDVSPNIVPVEPKDPHLSRSGSTSSSRKSISLTRSLSRALPRYNRGDKEKQANGKRKSQLVDIPFLETQLLPSLRDTIDRMTQPPRVRFPEDDESRVSPPDVGFSTMKSTSPYPQSPWASFQSHLDAPLSQQLPSISPRPPTHAPFGQLESFSSPSQNSCVSTFTRIPKSPMTRPSPSVTDSPRKPLKSALRAPTPSSLLTPIATHSTPNIPSPSFNSKSLRSVRSMVGGFSTRSPGEKQAVSRQ